MKELIIKTILEGLGLGALLVLVCAVVRALSEWYIFTVQRYRKDV